ncbi:MAG: hypothetical protein H7329_19330 [Opitutaceae bacterium]|nr:hypothetical protein [Cytophagales bacterium]
MKKSRFLLLFPLLFIAHLAFSQNSSKERIMIRVYEYFQYEIIVTTANGSEKIELKGGFKSLREENNKIILATLNKYLSNGYKIETSNCYVEGQGTITTYILIKE